MMFEDKEYDFCSTQFSVPYPFTSKIYDFGLKNIPNSKLADEKEHSSPRQVIDDIHLTVLFGLKNCNYQDVLGKIVKSGLKSVSTTLGKIGKFSLDDCDAIYLEVNPSFELAKLRSFIKNNFENQQTYNEFRPHITLAYVKQNSCNHLVGDDVFDGEEISMGELCFSDQNGTKHAVTLDGFVDLYGKDERIYRVHEYNTPTPLVNKRG